MENTLNQEPELEKHDDTMPEGTPLQQEEKVADETKEKQVDPIKKLQDELAEAKDKYVLPFFDSRDLIASGFQPQRFYRVT